MQPRRTVFVGSDPPPNRVFDWAVEPAARISLDDAVSFPDIGVIKGLLDEAVPVVEALADGRFWSLLRDELLGLVLFVARVEATVRALDRSETYRVVGSRQLPRPSRPGNIAAGLAGFLGADLEWTGWRSLQRFPAGMVGSARAWRWSRGRPGEIAAPVIVAVGGPSELRALQPVCDQLDPGSFVLRDFSLQPGPGLQSFGSFLSGRDAMSNIGHRAFLERTTDVWASHDWWGARWLPWVKRSLDVMSRITLREAVLFHKAALRAFGSSELLVTAKVRYARARAILAAARESGVMTVGVQHGMYVDGNKWTDIQTDVFAVSGDSFARILERNGYRGTIVSVGAPFFRSLDREWDCGIALQPPEGIVIISPSDYERHALAAYETARQVLGEGATIGFRMHPREDERVLRRIVGDDTPISRDPDQGAALWLTIESSFVVQAMLSGSPTVLFNLNSHPWEFRFGEMEGSLVATTPDEIRLALEAATRRGYDPSTETWRREFAVATGDIAAAAIARLITERIG